MSTENEIEGALRFLRVSGSKIATPKLIEQARRFIHLQRQIAEKRQEQERVLARVSSFPGHLYTLVEQMAPPLQPVRDLLEEALVELHLPGRAVRGLHFPPGNVVMDFAFPATRLCILIGESSDLSHGCLPHQGWRSIHFQESDIRRDAVGCARRVKDEYGALKNTRPERRDSRGTKC
jgi:hypothetical protein